MGSNLEADPVFVGIALGVGVPWLSSRAGTYLIPVADETNVSVPKQGRRLLRWAGLAALVVVIAVGVNALVPPIRGPLAMGVAAVVLYALLSGVRRLRS